MTIIRSVKWLLFNCSLMAIFESVGSSFISWSHSNRNHNNNRHDNVNVDVNVNNVGYNIDHRIFSPSLSSITTRTNTKTRIASTSASSSNGNITAAFLETTTPSFGNGNRNINESVEIAIIGPLLNVQKPVIVGDSIWLDPPTPLQWKTIEASVEAQHGGTIMNWKSTTASEIDDMAVDKINLATTDNSPLVAILHNGGKEYATIASIEGIVTKKDGSIDTSDAESFRESLADLNSPYYSDSSKIRLMAVGRAKLSHFTTKFLKDDSIIENEDKDSTNDINSIAPEPLLVARMELLMDSNEKGMTKASPVHALNRLSTFAQRVRLLHQDRQRIVRGLQAAQSRLEMAMDDWEDWDGIGSLNTDVETTTTITTTEPVDDDAQTRVLNEFLREYDNNENDTILTPTHSLPLSPGAARCMELDNYGLGTTSGAYVPLTSMAEVLVEKLEKYYSPTRLQTEEFEYEAFSWCALQSLQTYLSSQEIHEALYKCKNTCGRLEILYHAMIKHKMDLNVLAQAKSIELRNCGEECDLF